MARNAAQESSFKATVAADSASTAQGVLANLQEAAQVSEQLATTLEADAKDARRKLSDAEAELEQRSEAATRAAEDKAIAQVELQANFSNMAEDALLHAMLKAGEADQKISAVESAIAEGSSNVKLQAYRGPSNSDNGCNFATQNLNWDWCDQASSACKPQIDVSENICSTGVALLLKTTGNGIAPVSVNGCTYAYFAQYACKPAAFDKMYKLTPEKFNVTIVPIAEPAQQ